MAVLYLLYFIANQCCFSCDLQQKGSGSRFKDDVIKALLGSVVMTRYNNKTYRVDDIMWDMNPGASFELSSGEKITFKDYYL